MTATTLMPLGIPILVLVLSAWPIQAMDSLCSDEVQLNTQLGGTNMLTIKPTYPLFNITEPEDCCHECKIFEDGTAPELNDILQTKACNAWTFCHDEQGCGGSVVYRECTLKFSNQAYNQLQFGPVEPVGSLNDPRFHSGIVDREMPVGDPKCNAFTYRRYDTTNIPALQTFVSDGPDDCCQACEDLEACNFWVLCNNERGCGASLTVPYNECKLFNGDVQLLIRPENYPEDNSILVHQFISGYILGDSPFSDGSYGNSGDDGSSGTDQVLPFILITIGVAIVLVVSIAFLVHRRRTETAKQQLSEIKSKARDFQRNSESCPSTSSGSKRMNFGSTLEKVDAVDLLQLPAKDIQVLEYISRGSSGEVFRGKWLSQDVAIKKILDTDGSMIHAKEFQHEANLLVSLRHENIVAYYGYCVEPHYICLVMEYMERGSLDKVLRARSHIGKYTRLYIALQVAKGMEYLHSKRIVHRDLKAGNILLSSNLDVKVADFGLSLALDTVHSGGDSLVGTPGYMAPEVLKGEKYNRNADTWSFGSLLYNIITGEHAYGHYKDGAQVIAAVYINEAIPEYTRRDDAVDEDISDMIKCCCSYDPAERPTFSELVPQLAAMVEGIKAKGSVADDFVDEHGNALEITRASDEPSVLAVETPSRSDHNLRERTETTLTSDKPSTLVLETPSGSDYSSREKAETAPSSDRPLTLDPETTLAPDEHSTFILETPSGSIYRSQESANSREDDDDDEI